MSTISLNTLKYCELVKFQTNHQAGAEQITSQQIATYMVPGAKHFKIESFVWVSSSFEYL